MTLTQTDFVHSDQPEPHRARTRAILQEHPELREHIGKNPYTFGFILVVLAAQLGLAIWSAALPWWGILLLAYLVGSFLTHASGMLIHECAHGLVFRSSTLNYLAGILADLTMVVPSSVGFKRYHLKHHAFQGVHELDADIAYRWEAKAVGSSVLAKALWMLLFPIFQLLRPMRLKEIRPIDGWIVLNMFAVFAADLALLVFVGPKALLYLFLSFLFAFGLHPLGGRWIGEHYLVAEPQETYSYYGPLNTVSFNIGYHNEHHDFPSVPWNRLPRVKSTAPEWYGNLVAHHSWTRMLFRFLFDRKLSLFSRVVREHRGGVALSDAVTPDRDRLDAVREPQGSGAAGA